MTEKFDNDKTSTNEYNLEKLINEIEAKQLEFVVETKEHEINSLLEENKTLLLENKNLFNVLKDKDKQIQELCKKLKEERDQNTILLNMALANNKDDESHSVNNFNLNLENKQLAPGIQKIIQIQKIIDEQEKEIQMSSTHNENEQKELSSSI